MSGVIYGDGLKVIHCDIGTCFVGVGNPHLDFRRLREWCRRHGWIAPDSQDLHTAMQRWDYRPYIIDVCPHHSGARTAPPR